MRTSIEIKEHLEELYITESKYPNILMQFVDYWEEKLVEAATKEELNKI